MVEPEYIYIKGEGWVLAPPYKIEVFEKGLWRVTFENRHPNIGEYFFNEGNFEMSVSNLKGWDYNSNRLDISMSRVKYTGQTNGWGWTDEGWVVMRFERL